MKSITIDMAENSMLLFGKVIDRVKKGLFDVALLSHVTDYEFNEMILFDVRIFSVEKENFLRKYTIVVTLVLILSRKMNY